jgi:ornithine racemase
LHAGADRHTSHAGIVAAATAYDALGLLWIDAAAALMPDNAANGPPADNAVLRRVIEHARPRLSPENIVLVGLRVADPLEAAAIEALGISVFTMADIDAVGLRHIMREALKIVAAGVQGFHVHYTPEASDLPGGTSGLGGITVRETHQAMEAVAAHRGMVSFSLCGMTENLPHNLASECVSFVLSASGKRIL